jgi:hypothetical protein
MCPASDGAGTAGWSWISGGMRRMASQARCGSGCAGRNAIRQRQSVNTRGVRANW